MELTIGMATYQDFDGVYFTLQALRLYQDLEGVELLVVDNYGCSTTREFVENGAGGRYILFQDRVGTAAPREQVFREARGDAVLCLDSHVLLVPGAVARLKRYYREHPDSSDLLQGPLVYDDLRTLATHFEPIWRDCMWGVWAVDDRAEDPEAEPFEIPMQGLGLFSCRRAAWPGFNPHFRGFGGEEGYLHQKVRNQGGRCLCLPWLRWVHRFPRTAGVPYRLQLGDRIFNYLLGHRELGLDEQPVEEHFAAHHSLLEEARAEVDTVLSKPARPVAQTVTARVPADLPRPLTVLGCWYTNNVVHPKILRASLNRLALAQKNSRQRVEVLTCSWETIAGNPFPAYLTHFRLGVHLGIAMQILRILYEAEAAGLTPDLVCFLEHDVLYPEDYFDRMARAVHERLDRLGASNLDCIGMNHTGWCQVICRQEPMHQMALRFPYAVEHLEQVQRACIVQAAVNLEPDDKSILVRLPYQGDRPSVHINHNHHFTSHPNCYARDSVGETFHPYWGPFQQYYPEEESQAP
jgi:Glycosyl transferase family 2